MDKKDKEAANGTVKKRSGLSEKECSYLETHEGEGRSRPTARSEGSPFPLRVNSKQADSQQHAHLQPLQISFKKKADETKTSDESNAFIEARVSSQKHSTNILAKGRPTLICMYIYIYIYIYCFEYRFSWNRRSRWTRHCPQRPASLLCEKFHDCSQ